MERMEEYLKAIKQHVGRACLDRKDDGTCDPPEGRKCALDLHLPLIVEAIKTVDSEWIADYARTLGDTVCSQCPGQDERARCYIRDHRECCLDNFVYLVVEAIEETDRRHEEGNVPDHTLALSEQQ